MRSHHQAPDTTPALPDSADLHPLSGEVLVTVGIYGDGRDLPFPATVTEWTPRGGYAVPRFRREVADMVLAWINHGYQHVSVENPHGRWEDAVLVLHSPAPDRHLCCTLHRYAPDETGRYAIGAGVWRWTVWHPDKAAWRDAISSFEATDARLSIWRRYPEVSEADNQVIDTYACREVSAAFARHAATHGLRTCLIEADDCDHPRVDRHWWVVVYVADQAECVDWTARQFHNLEHPPLPEHADIPFPLTWNADYQHPVVGRFATVTKHPTAEQETHGQ